MKPTYFDKIIVSSDDSSFFLNFWPIVCKAWQKYFDVTPTLAFVSNRADDDALVKKLKTHGEVVIVPELYNIPRANQAKVARFLVASTFGDQVCTIEDIDTIPLEQMYIKHRLSLRPKNKILAVGREVLENTPHHGKFPISHITAEGSKFKELFNPRSLDYAEAIKSLTGMRIFDSKEDINNNQDHFSDESLVRALIHVNCLKDSIFDVRRDVDIKNEWIDRSWWNIDVERLEQGKYISCNFIRPFRENAASAAPVIKYVYGKMPSEDEIFIL